MSRAWRIEYEGACYHLLSRGNEGQDIFIGEQDRTEYKVKTTPALIINGNT
jgi:hypothetical protein